MASDYLSSLGGGGARGMARYGRSVSIPKRVGAAYQGARTPATVAARIGAQLIDWLLVLPVGISALLVWAAVPEATGGTVRLPPVLAFAGVLLVHWLHALALEGGAAAATLGKRLVGLQVVTGHGGVPLGAGPALLRRAAADLWLCGGVWWAVRLTSYRQHHDLFAPDAFAGADWGVFALFVLVFYVPWFGYRASAFGCQWPHDRLCDAVVVWRVKTPAPIEARPVAPLPPLPEPAGAVAAEAVGGVGAETTALFAAAQRQAASIGAPPVAQPHESAAQPPAQRSPRRIAPPPARSVAPQPKSLAAKSPPGEGAESAAAPARTPPPAAGDAADELPAPPALPPARPAAGGGSESTPPIDGNSDADAPGDGDAEEEAVEESNDP